MSEPKGLRVRDFFDREAQTLLERYRIFETLLPNPERRGAAHAGEEGRHIEALLRDFLNKHLPANIRALSGFILRPSTKVGEYDLSRVEAEADAHSRQIDIIVYDVAEFPIYERFEEFVIVPPEGVVAVISVKKTLYKSQLTGELTALRGALDLCQRPNRRAPFSALFAFSLGAGLARGGARACYDAIERIHAGDRFDGMITEICVLQDFVAFKFREGDSGRPGYAKYVEIDIARRAHVGLQRMLNSILSVYYDETPHMPRERPGFVSFEKGVFSGAPPLGWVRTSSVPTESRQRSAHAADD